MVLEPFLVHTVVFAAKIPKVAKTMRLADFWRFLACWCLCSRTPLLFYRSRGPCWVLSRTFEVITCKPSIAHIRPKFFLVKKYLFVRVNPNFIGLFCPLLCRIGLLLCVYDSDRFANAQRLTFTRWYRSYKILLIYKTGALYPLYYSLG